IAAEDPEVVTDAIVLVDDLPMLGLALAAGGEAFGERRVTPVVDLASGEELGRLHGCDRPGGSAAAKAHPPTLPRNEPAAHSHLHDADTCANTEPNGAVCESSSRCLVRRALGRHPTRRPGAARTR